MTTGRRRRPGGVASVSEVLIGGGRWPRARGARGPQQRDDAHSETANRSRRSRQVSEHLLHRRRPLSYCNIKIDKMEVQIVCGYAPFVYRTFTATETCHPGVIDDKLLSFFSIVCLKTDILELVGFHVEICATFSRLCTRW